MAIGRRTRDALAVIAIALACAGLLLSPAFERGRGLSLDALTWLRFEAFGNRHDAATSPAVVIAIDEESYQAPPFKGAPLLTWTGEIGRVLTAVLDGGAKVVGFDMVFQTSIEQSEIPLGDSTLGEKTRGFDRDFLRALASAATGGKVVLGEIFGEPPILPAPGQRIAVRQQQNLRPLNTYTDSDDVVRRHPLSLSADGKIIPSMALELAARATGAAPIIAADRVTLGDYAIPGRVPGTMTLNFAGGADDIPTYSFADLRACALKGDKDYFRREFTGKVVLIGTVGIEDRRVTSKRFATRAEGARRPRCVLGERRVAETFARSTIAGVYIHATAVNNLVRQEAAVELSRPAIFAIAAGMALLAALFARLLRPIVAGAILALLAALYVGLATTLFNRALALPLGEPLAAGVLALVATTGYRFMVTDKDRRLLQKSFAYYLAPREIDRMLASRRLPQLGGETREVTVFFSDIEGFSRIAEQMSPEQLMALTNEYLSAMTDVIEAHDGYVDKYIGDSVVAVFGAPLDDPDHAKSAARAALDCKAKLDELNRTSTAFQGIKVAQRVGINSGAALVGNFGSQRRFNYSVMSDAVNVASRLEGANKFYGTTIIASESTRSLAGDAFAWRELDTIRVKGREQSLTIYELHGCAGELSPQEQALLSGYAAGLAHWRAGELPQAAECFAAGAHDDRPSALFAARVTATTPNDATAWDPVRTLQEK
ncbi:putative adenylate/guanylyl cyclase with a CHASE2 domain [Bradyrhizobium sp. ORS 285]|uniref:adenylate/guanylate cyclase domain-containing protein n=1 Tax=Bradyrhizobium sp. ORS 285 TaxID=115808 RepID=UPI000240A048|nr:adenylate/guanylate cyclase domain-containing protein [Bradyrhizobium sp. ORS 285]CCD87578.1 putative adenylate/guanylyl cyclase with a CHASE2 domain; signal peptide [Bradyrhizobium sp. ORS 285]SMX57795.1 putative adenylate/guanylyl cyclase with a CHASE2 domain [Bradyrhizobium sp. ORS 285]